MFNTRFGKLKKLYLQNTSRGVDGVHKNEGRLLTEQPLSHLDYNRSIIECYIDGQILCPHRYTVACTGPQDLENYKVDKVDDTDDTDDTDDPDQDTFYKFFLKDSIELVTNSDSDR
ncbi:hypothetical protein ACTFIT_010988 [Dictyostelium discoideum]